MIAHTALLLAISMYLLLIYPSLMLCSIHAPIRFNVNVSKEQGWGAGANHAAEGPGRADTHTLVWSVLPALVVGNFIHLSL